MMRLGSILALLFMTGCTFAEINIVQRSVMESGESLSNSSLDKNLREESTQMELVVPLK